MYICIYMYIIPCVQSHVNKLQVDSRMSFVVLFEGVLKKGGQSSIVRFLQFVGEVHICIYIFVIVL